MKNSTAFGVIALILAVIFIAGGFALLAIYLKLKKKRDRQLREERDKSAAVYIDNGKRK